MMGRWEMGDGRWGDEKLNYHPPDPKFFSQTPKALSYLKRNHLSRSKTLALTLWTWIKIKLGCVISSFLVCSCDVCFSSFHCFVV